MPEWQKKLLAAQKAAAEARSVYDGAKGRAMTEQEVADYDKHYKLAVDLKAESDRMKKADEQHAELDALAATEDPDEEEDAAQVNTKRTPAVQVKERTFGDRFINTESYRKFKAAHPSGVGNGTPVDLGRQPMAKTGEYLVGRKALQVGVARQQVTRYPTIDMVQRDGLSLLDLISHGTAAGAFEYVQIVGVTRNAKIVKDEILASDPSSDLKPLSDMSTQLADAKPYTYADGYEVTNQLLSDAPAFASYMNQELSYSLDNVIEDKLLNGTGTNGEPKGILTTTGVQDATYTGAVGADGMPTDATVQAFIKAVRKAIMNIVRIPGGTVGAILMSPEMDAAIDLVQDQTGRYYGAGPFTMGPNTLWGRPRATSERLNVTDSLLGDWTQVQLLDVEGLSVQVFNQHKDYAQRNLNYVRAELRAEQVIWRPNRLAHLHATAA